MAYKFQKGSFKPAGALDLSATGESAANSITFAAGAVVAADLAAIDAANKISLASIDIDGATALGGATVAQADLLIIDDGAGGTNKSVTFSNFEDSIFGNVSGDATIAAGGALTIANDAVEQAMIADDAVGADQLASNAVVNASIASNAAIDIDKIDGGSCASSLSDLAQGDLLYAGDADASNAIKSITFSNLEDAIFGNVSGDATIAAGGALTIASDAVEPSMINVLDDSLAATNTHFLIADGTDYSSFALSGDITCTNAGVVTIAAGAVDYAMIASAAIKDEDDMASDSASHLVTQQSVKAYVDSKIAGLDVKASVKAVYPASFTMASTASTSTLVLANGEGGFDSSADTLTVDGVSVSAGARVLIKEGVNSNGAGVHKKWNGVYTVGALNGGTCTLTRATDFDAASEFVGAPFFMVDDGSTFGAYGFVADIASNPTIGTTAIPFVLFTSPGQDAVAGAGLNKNANVLSVDIDELDALGSASLHQTQDHFMVSDNGTEKKVTFSNLEDSIFGNVSGDATIAAGGALTIAADAVEQSMIADDAVGADQLAANAVVNASIASNAAIDIDKLDGGSCASSLSDLAQGDLLYAGDVDDSNNIKSITFSNLEDAIFGNVSGEATIAAGGALTIADSVSVSSWVLTSPTITTGIAPTSDDGAALGSANKNWSDLYLADGANIYMGDDQDVKITHNEDSGITLSTAGDGGSGPKAVLTLHYDSASPADNDFVGAVKFKGDDDGGNVTSYAEITGVSRDVSDGAEAGGLSFDVLVGGSPVGLLDICKTAASTVTISDGAYDFDVASHDGTNGLKLGGTLVGASAAEINAVCDASARTAATVNVAADHFIFCDGGATGASKVESIVDLVAGIQNTGLTAASGQLSITPGQTAISSIYNTGLKLGTASDQEYIDFSGTNEIKVLVNDSMVAAYEPAAYKIQNGAMHYKVQGIGSSGSPSASTSISATAGQIVIIYANASQTMTLPAKSGLDGAVFTIKNAGSNSFSLDPNGSEKIEGADQQVTVEAGAAVNVVCDSTGWWIF